MERKNNEKNEQNSSNIKRARKSMTSQCPAIQYNSYFETGVPNHIALL